MDLAALLQLPPGAMPVFLLMLVRISALFVTAPILGNAVVPVRFRVSLALLVTLLMLPVGLAQAPPALPDTGSLVLAVARELGVGLTLGFVSMMLFHGIQLAGHMIGMQMGFGMSMMFDPTTRTQTSELAVMLTLLATICFLAMDGHHWLLAAVHKSFAAVPLGTFTPGPLTVRKVLDATTGVFDVGLTLMLPILGMLIVIELALAIMNRSMPQMNVFSLGSGLKIGLGVAALTATMPLLGGTLGVLIERLARSLVRFF